MVQIPGKERHHLIPYHLKDHPIFIQSILDINDYENMMYLPLDDEGPGSQTRHSNFMLGDCHHRFYDRYMLKKLDEIERIAKQNNWSKYQIKNEIINLEKSARKVLDSGRKT